MSIVALALFGLPFLLTATLASQGVNLFAAAGGGWLVLVFISWCFAKDE